MVIQSYYLGDGHSPRSYTTSPQGLSPRSDDVSFGHASPRSIASYEDYIVPTKKIIKKKRWVSIYDGRPVTPYVETITYEPATTIRRRISNVSPYEREVGGEREPTVRIAGECAMFGYNPIYRE